MTRQRAEELILKASLCSAAHYGANKLYFNESNATKQAMMCGGAQVLSDVGEGTIGAMLLPGSAGASVRMMLNPVLTGAGYVALNAASPQDNRSKLIQFFHATGSSLAAGYTEPSIRVLAGL